MQFVVEQWKQHTTQEALLHTYLLHHSPGQHLECQPQHLCCSMHPWLLLLPPLLALLLLAFSASVLVSSNCCS
jgi:hypothetical protein